jgi:MFS family permease
MSERSAKASLLTIFLIVFIDLIGFGMVLPLLPVFAEHFHVDEHGLTLGLLMASFSAMQFLVAPLWGRVSDRVGRRPILMIGLAGSVVFYFLFGIATIYHSLALLFISRLGAGVAGATISTAHAYIADITTLENRTKGMALVGAAFGLGFTLGPLFAVLALLGKGNEPGPGPGYAASALSAVALLLAYFKLPESLPQGGGHAARKWFDYKALHTALTIPSVGLLLLTSFVCVFSFANFESTLSLSIFRSTSFSASDHDLMFRLGRICQTFAFIGLTLMIVQGGIVRRLSGRIADGTIAATGAGLQIAGFILQIWFTQHYSLGPMLFALALTVSGFAFVTPSLNALISRRSDPAQQGSILGLGQSISSLARILGPMAGIPLFKLQPALPLITAAGLMTLGLLCVLVAARRGKDFGK